MQQFVLQIFHAFLEEYLAILAIVIALIAVGIALSVWRKRSRSQITLFKGVEAYIVRAKDGGMQIIFDDDPNAKYSRIVRGRAIKNYLRFSIYNEELEVWTFRNLVDHRSGAISLKAHLCYLKPFMAKSNDDYEFETRPRVRFRLRADEASIKHALANEDFDQSFRARIESAFREEIASRDDKAVGRERALIHDNVLKRLRELEAEIPLGIEYLEVLSSVIKQTHSPHRDYVLAQGAGATDAEGKPRATSAPQIAFGAMDHTIPELDSIRDMFLVKGWDDAELFSPEQRMEHYNHCNMMLVKMLELQTRENVAASLVGSGNLLVLSTDDVGLSRAELVREAMKQAPHKLVQPQAPHTPPEEDAPQE
ncbi:MAG: hypothetical protein MRY74_03280 [Neomegalonema sp.]|nr:hypothetical protein [Neomegalonema sp.]